VAIAGAVMLAYVGWCWAGRTAAARAWARVPARDLLVLGLFPGLGLVLLASGIAAALPESLVGWAAPLILAGFLLFALGMVYLVARPRWWGPRWYWKLTTRNTPSQTAAARSAADIFGAGARPIARFPGAYGRTAGEVAIFPQGLAFAASTPDDKAFVVLKKEDIREAHRTSFRRAVVHTAERDYVFAVAYGRAGTLVRQLCAVLEDE
jgi:hypothetical protein